MIVVPIASVAGALLMYGVALERARSYGLRLFAGHPPSLALVAVASATLGVLLRHDALTWPLAAAIACAAVCAVTDAQTGYIFDRVLLTAGVLIALPEAVAGTLARDAVGALFAGSLMAVPFLVTRGRGMGLGDVKLAALLGLGLGSPGGLLAVGCACVLAGVTGVALLVLRRATPQTELRFGPFLSVGACLVMLRPA